MSTTPTTARPQFDRAQQIALIVGIVGLGVGALGAFLDREQFFQSYLVAYMYWLSLTVGSLALCLLQHLAGGVWGAITRRPLEAGMMTLPLMFILFLPILLGMSDLYVWARPPATIEAEAGKEVAALIQSKTSYLNGPFFIIRYVFYFALWFGMAYLLYRWSAEQDRTGDPRLFGRFKGLSGIGLVLFFLSMTFASVDWSMSIDPAFFSAIYGVIYIITQGLITFAFLAIVLALLVGRPPLAGVVTPARVHDLGKLTLAFVMLWTYMNLSQFIIIWSGNLPEEIPWYIQRGSGGWDVVSLVLFLFNFAVPFFILLSRPLKRSIRSLAILGVGILVMNLVNVFWMIAPSFHPEGFTFSWLDLVLPIGMGGIWVAAFIWLLKRRPLLPLHDWRLELAGAYPQAAQPLTDTASGRVPH